MTKTVCCIRSCSLTCTVIFTGKPSKDPDHPDYAPSVFAHVSGSKQQGQRSLERFKRRCEFHSKPVLTKRQKVHAEEMAESEPVTHSQVSAESQDIGEAAAEPEMPESCFVTDDNLRTQIKSLETEINFLRSERDAEQAKNVVLQKQLDNAKLSSSSLCVENDNKKCKFYTGISFGVFTHVLMFLQKYVIHKQTKDSLPFKDQLFLTFVRLRLGLPFKFIAQQSNSSEETIRRYFWIWIKLITSHLNFLLRWPSRKAIRVTLPSLFRVKYPRLTAIIDCFEIFIDQSKNLQARAQTWSNYKHHNTIKVFIACSPTGAISYLSLAWGGRVSDVELVRQSGFISSNLHLPGDQILADRGFTLQDDFAAKCSAELIIPSFTRGKQQLEAVDVEKSRNMSRVRVHIERVIGVLKRRFRILQGVMSIRSLKSSKTESDESQLANVDKILRACAILVNLGESIVVKKTVAE